MPVGRHWWILTLLVCLACQKMDDERYPLNVHNTESEYNHGCLVHVFKVLYPLTVYMMVCDVEIQRIAAEIAQHFQTIQM